MTRPAVPPSIFRAYDIRGVVGQTLTADIAHRIGLGIGSEARDRGEQAVIIGRDGRHSSPELAGALVAGLRESGRDVVDINMVPTPLLYFATHWLQANCGVMVTGSHNGPEYNGVKLIIGGQTLFGDALQAIYRRIVAGSVYPRPWRVVVGRCPRRLYDENCRRHFACDERRGLEGRH